MQLAIRNIVACARTWARARAKCRRIADSRSASPKDLERAKRGLSEASDDLANAVDKLEALLLRGGGKTKKPINWQQFFGAVSTFASAVESAVRERPHVPVGVIDTTGEEVRGSRQRQRRGM